MGNFTFFETDQVHMGSVINHYRSIGANDHLLCVMCGRFTKTQRQIAREQATLNTKLYVDLMTWFIRESNHPAYQGLTPPESCPAPQIIEDAETDNNTDQPQNPQVENQYQGGTFTFTSSNDPTESTGTYTSNTSFAAAIAENYEKKGKKWKDTINKAHVGIIRNSEYKTLEEVIGYHSTLDAVAKMFGAYFDDDTFKNIATDVIAMYFNNDVDVTATIKELEFRHLNEN